MASALELSAERFDGQLGSSEALARELGAAAAFARDA
jgi:hypothetical protein